jgi:drug/metabolite transporter (DMT)-like permease
MKTIIIVFIAALCAAIGETFLSYGMRRIGQINWLKPAEWVYWFIQVVSNPNIIIGVGFLACFFFLYLVSLSQADLSFVMPLTSASFIFAAFMARFFLREEVSWLRWMGILIISVGIMFVAADQSRMKTQTQAANPARAEAAGGMPVK